jgi:hypothetical protein
MYLYEFLWRGRPNGETAYHVILGEEVDTLGKKSHIESHALTPEQAEEMGFPIASIIENINAMALIERDRAIADKIVAESQRDEALSELNKANEEIAAFRSEKE